MTAPLIVGNWKMNGLAADLVQARELATRLEHGAYRARAGICPPATLLERMARELAGSPVLLGGQDCHAEAFGAFTGEISAEMLAEAGASLVIVGHSERRAAHRETDTLIRAKASAAVEAGLLPILCVGETFAQRQAGIALDVITGQVLLGLPRALAGLGELEGRVCVAYEPAWAVGTDLVPTIDQIEHAHATIRAALVEGLGAGGAAVHILYGGSVNAENAGDILHAAEVGGALIGRASLKADDFIGIIAAA